MKLYRYNIYLLALLIGLLAVVSCPVSAQTLSITSMVELNDLDARAYEPILDQNGKKCAILKIVTTEQGFTFDVGAMGVRKVVQKTAEIWVYVPPQTSKIKIAHPKLGQLDTEDGYYWFPIGGVREATCYRLKLVSGRLVTTVEEAVIETGFLVITTVPEGAEVYLEENGMESYVGITPFQRKMAYGDYRFRLEKPLYHSEPGVAHVNSSRADYPINLRPKFGTLTITSNPSGARVIVEDIDKEFVTPCTIERVTSGERSIRLTKDGYQTAMRDVEIQDGKTTEMAVELDARFASLTIHTLDGADIYLDGKHCGTGSYSESLTEGIYDVEVRMPSHRPAKKQVRVVAKQSQEITLEPTPMYGSLDVLTIPLDARLTLNGQDYGTTPLSINKLLVGDYTLTLSKDGYRPLTKQISIAEKQNISIDETLQPTTAPTPEPRTASPESRPAKPEPRNAKPEPRNSSPENHPAKPSFHNSFFFALNAGYRFKTTPSIGLTLGQEIKRSGWYMTASTGFSFKALKTETMYTCNNDGVIESNGLIPPYTGKVGYTRLSFIVGSMLRVHQTTAIYAGVGYGFNGQGWQIVGSGRVWARNADSIIQGVDAQLGLHFNLNGFLLRAGVATTNFKTFEGNIGIGYALKTR